MRVELAENEAIGVTVRIAAEPAIALATSGLVQVTPRVDGAWALRPSPGKVGAVRVGDLEVVVGPKAPFSSVLFMLGYARDPGLRPEDVEAAGSDEVWPILAVTLERLMTRALERGVLQGYVLREDALPLVRGRIRVGDQLSRRSGLPLPLEVQYDEYEVDIAENRVLRAAVRRMSFVPGLDLRLRSRLRHLDGRLDGVSVLPVGAPLPRWRPSRVNSRYLPALRMAELVLRHVGLATIAGGGTVAAFVVDMAQVFEDFVGVALGRAWARESLGSTRRQFPAHLDVGGRMPIRPDVVHVVEGRPVAVLDAKYKLGTQSGAYPVEDLYQLFTYCTVLGLQTGWLIYAGTRAGTPEQTRLTVANSSIRIAQCPLDVSAAPRELLQQLRHIARLAYSSVE